MGVPNHGRACVLSLPPKIKRREINLASKIVTRTRSRREEEKKEVKVDNTFLKRTEERCLFVHPFFFDI